MGNVKREITDEERIWAKLSAPLTVYICDRNDYFNKDIENAWIEISGGLNSYNTTPFFNRVYKINDKEYPFCTKEFKKKYTEFQIQQGLI